MRKAIAAALIGLIAGAGVVVMQAAPAAADTISPTLESGFVVKINALRAAKGLGQLAVHDQLVSIGRSWAQQMANAGEISHNANFPNQVTVNWKKLGENVGRGGEIDSLFQAFVNSPAHYANLVDPAFNYVGVGVVVKPDGTMFTSHQFMQLGSGAAPAPAPAPSAPRATAAPRTTSAPRATTPRPASAPKPAAAAPAPAAPTPPPPPPVPPARIVLSLEMLQGKAAA
jgi:hypothetical protein